MRIAGHSTRIGGIVVATLLGCPGSAGLAPAGAEGALPLHPAALENNAKDLRKASEPEEPGHLGYRLGVGDRIRLKVYERDDISGEFRVRTDGLISVPLLGTFPALDKLPEELEESIKQTLADLTSHSPKLSVEVVEWRPVFVTGVVEKPGVYPFAPGMIALHAVAAAGGIYRPISAARVAVDLTRELSEQRQVTEKLKRALSRKARLQAEMSGAKVLTAPDRLVALFGADAARAIIQAETPMFERRNFYHKRRVDAAQQEVEHASAEVRAYRRQLEMLERRISLAKAELEGVEKLSNKGLTTQTRVIEIKQQVASLETQWHEVEADIARAERTIASLEDRKSALEIERGLELEEQVKSVDDEIRSLELQISASRSVVREMAPELGNSLAGPHTPPSSVSMVYEVVRLVDGRQTIIPASETMLLLPGDVLRAVVAPGQQGVTHASRTDSVAASRCSNALASEAEPSPKGHAPLAPC